MPASGANNAICMNMSRPNFSSASGSPARKWPPSPARVWTDTRPSTSAATPFTSPFSLQWDVDSKSHAVLGDHPVAEERIPGNVGGDTVHVSL